MRHLDYYDGFHGTDEPDFETWLIVIIEGLYYCESKNAKWIKRSKLENKSNALVRYHFSKVAPLRSCLVQRNLMVQ